MSGTNHFCIFEVGNSFFAASAEQIRQIAPTPNYSRIPCNSLNLAGLWHEGSEFLPVIRLPFQSEFQPEKETQVLVIYGLHGHWGLLVEQVHTVTEIDYAAGTGTSDTEWSSAILGMTTWEDRSVRVLQLNAVYRLTEQNLKRDCESQLSTPFEFQTLSPIGLDA